MNEERKKRVQQRKEREKEQRHNEIIMKAMDLFISKGFDGTTMGDIALNYHEGVYSNPELGIGTLDYTPVGELSGNVTYSYNVNVTELDEAYNADDQVEL